MRLHLRRPAPGTVLGGLALFVALGGPAWAASAARSVTSATIRNGTIQSVDVKDRSLRGRDLARNTVTGLQVLETSLGKVPSAARADTAAVATRATSAAGADTATRATSAASADTAAKATVADSAATAATAGDAAALGGTAAGVYAKTADLATPASTPLTLSNNWVMFAASTTPAAVKDALGVVHLRGGLKSGVNSAIAFTLPSGLRPGGFSGFPVACASGTGYLQVNVDGTAALANQGASGCATYAAIDGVSFVAGG